MSKKAADPFLTLVESSIRKVLESTETKPGERAKMVEAAIKLLAIKHKLDGGGDYGSFFGGTGGR